MQRILAVTIILTLLLSGCAKPIEPAVMEFSIAGYESTLDGDNLLVYDSTGLKVIDLVTQKVRKEISFTPRSRIAGFDIYGDIVVWSDLRNEKRDVAELGDISKANADIFLYNLKTGEQKQITTDLSAQINPKIWKDYLVWQDNRHDRQKDYPGRWSLYLYDLKTGEEKLISSDLAAHATFNIKDNKIVWEDERNFKGENIVRGGDNVPENNKDIYLYDITTGKETPIATGSFMESNPDVSGNFVVYEDRNNGTLNADIILYNLATQEEKYLTKDKYNQATPEIYGNYVVWMDERRGTSTNDVYKNGEPPNSDIFLYDLTSQEERRLTGDGPQILPSISSEWVSFTYSRQVEPTIEVVRLSQTQLPKTLEDVVSQAIKDQRTSYALGETATEGHIILETEDKNGTVKVYTIASYGAFGFENGIFTTVSGSGAIPTVITFSKNENGEYSLLEYKEPMDGAGYTDSIKKMFPRKLHSKILSANQEYITLAIQQETQAAEYLRSIGRTAEVSADHVEKKLPTINVEASNKLFAELTKHNSFLNNCPYWLGTRETVENGVRYIYDTSQSKTDDGYDLIAFKKSKEDGTVVEEAKYKIIGSEPQQIRISRVTHL